MIPPAELGELEAFRSLLSGDEQAEIGGALCSSFEATPGSALFNRALGLGLNEPATEAALDGVDDFFSRRGLAYGIPLTPDAQPLQQHIPRRVLSRVNSYDALGSFVFIPLGLVIAGPLADRFGVTTTLWGFLAIGLASIGAALLSRDVRTLRRVDGAGYTEAEARATAAS